MRHFIFCHGFGFDADFWKNISPYFAAEKCTYLDLGYFDAAAKDIPDDGGQRIGIGHSLGLLKLLETNKKFDALIGLNSFVNFLGNEPNLRKKRLADLVLFKEYLEKSPIDTLDNFYQRCGIPHEDIKKQLDLHQNRLLADLDHLSMDVAVPKTIPMLIIGTLDDPITPSALLYDNFDNHSNVLIEILATGKHALGFLEAEKIYRRITSFLHASLPNNSTSL